MDETRIGIRFVPLQEQGRAENYQQTFEESNGLPDPQGKLILRPGKTKFLGFIKFLG